MCCGVWGGAVYKEARCMGGEATRDSGKDSYISKGCDEEWESEPLSNSQGVVCVGSRNTRQEFRNGAFVPVPAK